MKILERESLGIISIQSHRRYRIPDTSTPRYAREERAGRLADVLSRSRRKDSPVLRSTKARESAGRRARAGGRTGVDPELDTERGAQSGAERSRAEQSRAGQAREQCPFGVIPFLAIARILATRGMHAVTRLRARVLSLSFNLSLSLSLFLNAALARFLWKSRKPGSSTRGFPERESFPPLQLISLPRADDRARV